ncbi:hypothetical protein KOW79_010871 [Hemibagrus wyckioides]|uniref:Uncharacterized protein n=1 Tax=Hemibagrus wyckioides TaxID=337641 RepID=A0A9D3NLW1_9TELE|nr:hypothetical protein KOW79_010871 [Hemibagrus wyckioides]
MCPEDTCGLNVVTVHQHISLHNSNDIRPRGTRLHTETRLPEGKPRSFQLDHIPLELQSGFVWGNGDTRELVLGVAGRGNSGLRLGSSLYLVVV